MKCKTFGEQLIEHKKLFPKKFDIKHGRLEFIAHVLLYTSGWEWNDGYLYANPTNKNSFLRQKSRWEKDKALWEELCWNERRAIEFPPSEEDKQVHEVALRILMWHEDYFKEFDLHKKKFDFLKETTEEEKEVFTTTFTDKQLPGELSLINTMPDDTQNDIIFCANDLLEYLIEHKDPLAKWCIEKRKEIEKRFKL